MSSHRGKYSLDIYKLLRVIVSIITSIVFLVNTVCLDTSWAVQSIAQGDIPPRPLNVETFNVPEYLGHINDSYEAGDSKITVIHIQDAHCNYGAQHKISEIIGYLNEKYGIDTVNLEGGSKDYDLSIFTGIADKPVRDKVADYFVKEGLVNGAEYYAINNPEKAALWGIEDTGLYLDNLNVYRESLKHKDEVDKDLDSITHVLTNLKINIYSQELLAIDKKYSQYKAGNLEFKDYLSYLIQTGKGKAIDIKKFNNIFLLGQTLEAEAEIDFKKADSERDDLISTLQRKLSKKMLEELVIKTVEFRSEQITQKEFYAYLAGKAGLAGIDLKAFTDLNKYVVYISLYEAIDKMKVMAEMDGLENAIKEALYENDVQRELDKLSKNLAILKNIFNITLTKEDYAYYIANEQSFDVSNYVEFINREAPLCKITAEIDENIAGLDRYREDISKFYEYSLKRDEAFLKNIRFQNASLAASVLPKRLRDDDHGNNNLKVAVIVTGGFHTENLCELFKKKGISYISVMPNFKNGDGYESPYFNRLSGNRSGVINSLLPCVSSLALYSDFCANANDIYGKDLIQANKLWIRLVEALFIGEESVVVGKRFYTFKQDDKAVAVNGAVIGGQQVFARMAAEPEQAAAPRMAALKVDDKMSVPFTWLISALRNHIGKTGSSLYAKMKSRILKGEQPVSDSDSIGNIGQVNTLGTFIDEHFALPEEAVREIITNAYDSMHGELDPGRREVHVKLGDNSLSVSDNGSGMSLDTILKKLLPPFEGGKSSEVLAEIMNILDDGNTEKISRIKQLIASIDIANLSDTEKLTINDVQRRLNDGTVDEDERLKAIKSIATFTGRFGIGFYSLLYFLKTDEDSIDVVTSTGQEAHRVSFFRRDGELRTAITVLDPGDVSRGTSVGLKSQSFNKDNAGSVINQFLRFNSNAKISVSIDGKGPEIINEEVFSPAKFEHISNDSQVEAFYSGAENTSGKTTVYINVHGVTIMTKQIDGFGMPETVVFNFPANIGLPISRNKILVNDIFMEKAKDMIRLIAPKPQLLSAFFPCIEVLESSAKASYRNVLANMAGEAAYVSWSHDYVYLPNGLEYSRLKHDRLILVDPRLQKLAAMNGLKNNYMLIGEPLVLTSGDWAMIGDRSVYLTDFSDETKFVSSGDAILMNREHIPEIDNDMALYNVLFSLSGTGRFGYSYETKPNTEAKTDTPLETGKQVAAEDEAKIARIKESLPDETARKHFEMVLNNVSWAGHLKAYLDDPSLFPETYDKLFRSGLLNADFHAEWAEFYNRLAAADILRKEDRMRVVFDNDLIRQLQKYFTEKGRPGLAIDALAYILKEYEAYGITGSKVMERLWDLSIFLNDGMVSITSKNTYSSEETDGWKNFVLSGIGLDDDSYEKFKERLSEGATKAGRLDYNNYAILNSRKGLELFIESGFTVIERIADISRRLDKAFGEVYHGYSVMALSMRNLSEDEIKKIIESGKEDRKACGSSYIASNLPQYLRLFYGKDWYVRFADYFENSENSPEVNVLENIVSSGLPLEQKKRFVKAVMQAEPMFQNYRKGIQSFYFDFVWSLGFPFDFSLYDIEQIDNPALFILFIYMLKPFNLDFLQNKYSTQDHGKGFAPGLTGYTFMFKKELLHKMVTIFRYVSTLGDEFPLICEDFREYFSHDKISSRIEPFVKYLLKTEDAADIGDKEVAVQPQRKFTLVELYDTYLGLSQEEELREESSGIKGDFSVVDRRIDGIPAQKLTDERRKFLRNTFRAAAQQSVDDLVMLREVVQNVLDETPPGSKGQKVSINTYRKAVQLPGGVQELTVVDIEDSIGMNAERIFNKLLMPFSSSKKDPEKYLGKQGQGFFTLLANSEYVVIKTVRDGKACILKLIPERRNGQVVDFNVEEERRDALAGETNGTHMQAFTRSVFPGLEAERVCSAGKKFAALVDSNKLIVEVNGKQVNLNGDKLFDVEKSRYGEIEFYSMPGESFIALGGLFFKPLDDDFMALIPEALRPILLQHGFAINLPFQKIRRIQGGSDIANKNEVYDGIKDAVALGTMKLVIEMFARGDLPSLDMLGNDYYDWGYDAEAAYDAMAMKDGSADIAHIKERYFSPDSTNRLAKLLLAIPLDFLKNIFGEPLSLVGLFERYNSDPSFFNGAVMDKLPRQVRDAIYALRDKNTRKESQQEAAKSLGVPDSLIGSSFIGLPAVQGPGMAAYWAYLEMSDRIAGIAIDKMLKENSPETLGSLRQRLEYLRDNPTRSHYYAEPNGLSMAHARQNGRDYAWNLLEQGQNLRLFYKYLSRQITPSEFLDKAFEGIIKTLSHELIHILEESAEGTHNDVFLKRQKIMVSAMIGARGSIASVLADIEDNKEYENNLQDVSIKDFLEYVARSRTEVSAGSSSGVISTDTGLTATGPNEGSSEPATEETQGEGAKGAADKEDLPARMASSVSMRNVKDLISLEGNLADINNYVVGDLADGMSEIYESLFHKNIMTLAQLEAKLGSGNPYQDDVVKKALVRVYAALVSQGIMSFGELGDKLKALNKKFYEDELPTICNMFMSAIDQGKEIPIAEMEAGFSDPDRNVRYIACVLVGSAYAAMAGKEKEVSLGRIESMLNDDDWSVRSIAAEVIGIIYTDLIDRHKDIDISALEKRFGEERDDLLYGSTAKAMCKTYAALIKQCKEVSVSVLEEWLSDPNKDKRSAMAKAIGSVYMILIDNNKTIPLSLLEYKLTDEDGTTRFNAAETLGGIYAALINDGKMTLNHLQAKVRKSDSSDLHNALQKTYVLLVNSGKITLSELEAKLAEPVMLMRHDAVCALGEVYALMAGQGHEVPLSQLEGLVDHPNHGPAAASALKNIRTQSVKTAIDHDGISAVDYGKYADWSNESLPFDEKILTDYLTSDNPKQFIGSLKRKAEALVANGFDYTNPEERKMAYIGVCSSQVRMSWPDFNARIDKLAEFDKENPGSFKRLFTKNLGLNALEISSASVRVLEIPDKNRTLRVLNDNLEKLLGIKKNIDNLEWLPKGSPVFKKFLSLLKKEGLILPGQIAEGEGIPREIRDDKALFYKLIFKFARNMLGDRENAGKYLALMRDVIISDVLSDTSLLSELSSGDIGTKINAFKNLYEDYKNHLPVSMGIRIGKITGLSNLFSDLAEPVYDEISKTKVVKKEIQDSYRLEPVGFLGVFRGRSGITDCSFDLDKGAPFTRAMHEDTFYFFVYKGKQLKGYVGLMVGKSQDGRRILTIDTVNSPSLDGPELLNNVFKAFGGLAKSLGCAGIALPGNIGGSFNFDNKETIPGLEIYQKAEPIKVSPEHPDSWFLFTAMFGKDEYNSMDISNDFKLLKVLPDTAESRHTSNVASLQIDPVPGNVVRVVVAQAKVERDTRGHAIGDEGKVYENTARGISKGLSLKGFGVMADNVTGETTRDERTQVVPFDIETKKYKEGSPEAASAREEAVAAFIRSTNLAFKDLSAGGRVVAYLPLVAGGLGLVQIENGILIVDAKIQDAFKDRIDSHQLIIVPDAYSDLEPENMKYPDYAGRVALGRHVASAYNPTGREDAISRIKEQLQNLGENPDDIISMGADGILHFLRAVSIQPINFKSITDWQKSQEAIVTAV